MHEQPRPQERKRREVPPPEAPTQALEPHAPADVAPTDPRELLAELSAERSELREELAILNGALRMRAPNFSSLSEEHPISLKKGPNTALSMKEYQGIWDAKESIEERLKALDAQIPDLESAVYTPEEIAELRELEASLAPEEVPEALKRYATKDVGQRQGSVSYALETVLEKSVAFAPMRWYANYFKMPARILRHAGDAIKALIDELRGGAKAPKKLEGERKQLPPAPPGGKEE